MTANEEIQAMKMNFYEEFDRILTSKQGDTKSYMNYKQYMKFIEDLKEAKKAKKRTTLQYRRIKRFDLCIIDDVETLIIPGSSPENLKYYVKNEDLFDRLHEIHLTVGHGGRNRMIQEAKKKYANITQEAILLYLRFCKSCQLKLKTNKKSVLSNEVDHCQVDLIDIVKYRVYNNNLKGEKENFYKKLGSYYKDSSKPEWTSKKIQHVICLIEEKFSKSKTHYLKKYEVLNVDNEKWLIIKRKNSSSPVIQIIPSEEYYDKLLLTHISTEHGGCDTITQTIKNKFVIPTPVIKLFVSLCKTCQESEIVSNKTGIVVQPIISNDFNRRGQVDLIDFQSTPSNNFKWLLNYQDDLTKFCFLRPLTTNISAEVAVALLKIFLEVGCPMILQSNNGKEFTASVIKELTNLWPTCKVINGRIQQNSNSDVREMLRNWMSENNSTHWSIGCYFVQFQKNSSYHPAIGQSPYKALFGHEPMTGLTSTHLPDSILSKLENEEELEVFFEDQDDKNSKLKQEEENI